MRIDLCMEPTNCTGFNNPPLGLGRGACGLATGFCGERGVGSEAVRSLELGEREKTQK